jgi:hypothetical protein
MSATRTAAQRLPGQSTAIVKGVRAPKKLEALETTAATMAS